MRVRWPHMVLAAFLTTGMCVAALAKIELKPFHAGDFVTPLERKQE
jgi:hypothetical protein